jgi:hypothetical protein
VFAEALIGVGEVAISDHRSSQPTLDELLRLASEGACRRPDDRQGRHRPPALWATVRAAWNWCGVR